MADILLKLICGDNVDKNEAASTSGAFTIYSRAFGLINGSGFWELRVQGVAQEFECGK